MGYYDTRNDPPFAKTKTTLVVKRHIVAWSIAVAISTGAGIEAIFLGTLWIGPSSPEEYPSCPRFKPHVYNSPSEKHTECILEAATPIMSIFLSAEMTFRGTF
jgi:hypothetical protein